MDPIFLNHSAQPIIGTPLDQCQWTGKIGMKFHSVVSASRPHVSLLCQQDYPEMPASLPPHLGCLTRVLFMFPQGITVQPGKIVCWGRQTTRVWLHIGEDRVWRRAKPRMKKDLFLMRNYGRKEEVSLVSEVVRALSLVWQLPSIAGKWYVPEYINRYVSLECPASPGGWRWAAPWILLIGESRKRKKFAGLSSINLAEDAGLFTTSFIPDQAMPLIATVDSDTVPEWRCSITTTAKSHEPLSAKCTLGGLRVLRPFVSLSPFLLLRKDWKFGCNRVGKRECLHEMLCQATSAHLDCLAQKFQVSNQSLHTISTAIRDKDRPGMHLSIPSLLSSTEEC